MWCTWLGVRAKPTAPEAIDKALADIATRQRETKLLEGDDIVGAGTGHILTVDFLGKVDGAAFEGGTGTDMDVEIGGSGFIPGFSEAMIGMKPGDFRVIDVTFPAEYSAAELAGKAATFDITAKAINQGLARGRHSIAGADAGLFILPSPSAQWTGPERCPN